MGYGAELDSLLADQVVALPFREMARDAASATTGR
jgi:hypothetical protein